MLEVRELPLLCFLLTSAGGQLGGSSQVFIFATLWRACDGVAEPESSVFLFLLFLLLSVWPVPRVQEGASVLYVQSDLGLSLCPIA